MAAIRATLTIAIAFVSCTARFIQRLAAKASAIIYEDAAQRLVRTFTGIRTEF